MVPLGPFPGGTRVDDGVFIVLILEDIKLVDVTLGHGHIVDDVLPVVVVVSDGQFKSVLLKFSSKI